MDQAFELVRAGSKWSAALLRMVATLESFTQRFGVPASQVAPEFAQLVHAVRPPYRAVINPSWPLRIAAWIPQSVLDNQARKKQLGKFLVAGGHDYETRVWGVTAVSIRS